MVCSAIYLTTRSLAGLAGTSPHLRRWRWAARFHSVTSLQETTSATQCATTTPAAGMEETVRLILMIRGKTAPLLYSVGDTSMMGSVMGSVIALGVSMMVLIAKDKKDNASKCHRNVLGIFFKDLWGGIRILTQSYFVFQPSIWSVL